MYFVKAVPDSAWTTHPAVNARQAPSAAHVLVHDNTCRSESEAYVLYWNYHLETDMFYISLVYGMLLIKAIFESKCI